MNAEAHLLALGWHGHGHALDSYKQHGKRGLAYDPNGTSNSSANGLVKPLLVSQKRNTFGIGKRAHEPSRGNEWWLKGFESALQNIGKGGNDSSGTATPVSTGTGSSSVSANGYRGKYEGLYGYFSTVQVMQGTIEDSISEPDKRARSASPVKKGKKRKSDALEVAQEQSSNSVPESEMENTLKRARLRKEKDGAKDFEDAAAFFERRDKDEKRTRRKDRQDPTTDFEHMGQFFAARSPEKAAQLNGDGGNDDDNELAEKSEETSEERRAQRKARKEAKASREPKLLQDGSDKENKWKEIVASTSESTLRVGEEEEKAAKVRRKAERKRRKELEAQEQSAC